LRSPVVLPVIGPQQRHDVHSRRTLLRTDVPKSLCRESSQTNHDRASHAVESLWYAVNLTSERHHSRLHFPSPSVFYRRVFDVRSEFLVSTSSLFDRVAGR
jgi:hypothetical protein